MRTISVRTAPKGGAIRAGVEDSGGRISPRRLVLLIHGYNNTEDQARKAYRRFSRNTALDAPRVGTEVGEFFWPGDTGRPGSFLFYASQVPRAVESAQRLAEHLDTLANGQPLSVTFICHSLGNRLALETIAALRSRPSSVIVERFCSMAAAVAVDTLSAGQPLEQAARDAAQSIVLWSAKDRALGYAFIAGQYLAGDNERATAAVGKTGGPDLFWQNRRDFTGHGYGHGDYWPRAGSAASVSEFLDMTGIPRPLQGRAPQMMAAPEERELNPRSPELRRMRE
jgi:esterase/lipase superfamily enzyme